MQKPILFLLTLWLGSTWFSACDAQERVGEKVNIVFVSGSNEYFSHVSLNRYKQYLEEHYDDLQITLLQAGGELNEKEEYSDLPGVEVLEEADVALFFSRRLTIDGEQLEKIKDFIRGGGGVVALRTASHGFQNWLEFDKEVLGGNYHGHYRGSPEETIVDARGNRSPSGEPTGPITQVKLNPAFQDHPVLAGVTNFESKYSLYETSPVAEDVTVLMTGTVPEGAPEPVVWIRDYNGGPVCYISLGGAAGF